MEDITCPYCGSKNGLDPEYAYSIEEDEYYERECYECGKEFVITHTVIHYWDTQCTDSEHNLIPDEKHEGWGTCSQCDEFINLTN